MGFAKGSIPYQKQSEESLKLNDSSIDLSTLLIETTDDDESEIISSSKISSTPLTTSSIHEDKNVQEYKNTSPPTNTYSSESNSFDYENIESIESSCQLRRYTIQPKALNNRIVSNGSFIRKSITIEQCL